MGGTGWEPPAAAAKGGSERQRHSPEPPGAREGEPRVGFVFASSLGILTPQGRLGRCWYRGRESGALSASTGLL